MVRSFVHDTTARHYKSCSECLASTHKMNSSSSTLDKFGSPKRQKLDDEDAQLQAEVDYHIAAWKMQHQPDCPTHPDAEPDEDMTIPPLPKEFIQLADALIALGQDLPKDASPALVNTMASKANRLCNEFWENWWST